MWSFLKIQRICKPLNTIHMHYYAKNGSSFDSQPTLYTTNGSSFDSQPTLYTHVSLGRHSTIVIPTHKYVFTTT